MIDSKLSAFLFLLALLPGAAFAAYNPIGTEVCCMVGETVAYDSMTGPTAESTVCNEPQVANDEVSRTIVFSPENS